jgi:eukaryotic-like serine/threonine-protein kinase
MGVMREAASRYLGRYEVLEYLGSGGMSDVYVALHMGLRKKVALKVLRSTLRQDDDAIERFLREGECAARVSHPNVVGVHDVGVEEGVPYLVMELLSGEGLDKRLAREGTLPVEIAVDLLLPICDAIDHVHRAGVVHRDVKPSNILLAQRDDGSVVPKLVDFGVATLRERRLITGALGPIGTPTYMSPEQARGLDPVDGHSDQYSLASVLFELLTGREPYPGADIDSVLASVARGQFPRLSEALRHAPRGLDDVLARATAFHPRDRFASVREFAEALLPYASRRVRDTFHRYEGSGVADEHSGARLSLGQPPLQRHTARDSQATVRVRASVAGPAPRTSLEAPRQRRVLMGTVGVVALSLGLAVGITHLRNESSLVSARHEGAVRAAGQAALQAPLTTAPLAPHSTRARLSVRPEYALSVLDGRVLGQGDVQVPHAGDEDLHELRVSAPGYVTRVVLFRGVPVESVITLAHAP